MFTDYLQKEFNGIKAVHGQNSIQRVESMITSVQDWKEPLQKEAKYVIPGLTKSAWKEVGAYPEIARLSGELEKFYPVMRKEIDKLAQQNEKINTYEHYKVNLKEWKAVYIFQHGGIVKNNREMLPETYRFYENNIKPLQCPLGETHFSLLKAGVKIPPHSDLWNLSLNLHFAVKIPEQCGIRVAGETRHWQEGKCLLFDYSYEHEAWNNSKDMRICLLMDLWNPEITIPERKAATALINEIRSLLDQ